MISDADLKFGMENGGCETYSYAFVESLTERLRIAENALEEVDTELSSLFGYPEKMEGGITEYIKYQDLVPLKAALEQPRAHFKAVNDE